MNLTDFADADKKMWYDDGLVNIEQIQIYETDKNKLRMSGERKINFSCLINYSSITKFIWTINTIIGTKSCDKTESRRLLF